MINSKYNVSKITIDKYTNLNNLEDLLSLLFEGQLYTNLRTIKIKFTIFNDSLLFKRDVEKENSHWRIISNTNFIAPNNIHVKIKK